MIGTTKGLHIMIPVCIFVFFVIFFVIRFRWIIWQIERHHINITWYCVQCDMPEKSFQEMGEIWGFGHILLEFWCWNFQRYIVHQEYYEKVAGFIPQEMKKKNLAIRRRIGENVEDEKQPTDHGRN